MKVMVRRDSSTHIAVDVGNDAQTPARLRNLIDVHGAANVTTEDGKPVPAEALEPPRAPEATTESKPPKTRKARPAKAKAKATRSKAKPKKGRR